MLCDIGEGKRKGDFFWIESCQEMGVILYYLDEKNAVKLKQLSLIFSGRGVVWYFMAWTMFLFSSVFRHDYRVISFLS